MKNQIFFYLKVFLGALFVELSAFGISTLGLWVLQTYFNVENNFVNEGRMLMPQFKWYVFLLFGVILAGICEETIFRNPLKDFRYKDFILSIGLYVFTLPLNSNHFLMTISFKPSYYIYLFIGAVIIGGSFLIGNQGIHNKKTRIGLIIIMNLLFGISHFSSLILKGSYDLHFIINGLFVIFPFVALGLYNTFLRRKFSLKISIFAHIAINSLTFLSLYI